MFDSRRQMQCPRRGLENRFCDMVLISTIQILDVQIKPAFLHERLQEFFDQLRLQVADPCCLELHFVYKVRPARTDQ